MPRPNELIPMRGAIAEPLVLGVVRNVTREDVMRLGEAPKVGVPVLQRLRATHHKQAALLAQGRSVSEVAAIIGCTPQRITQLQNDPTFSELVHYYHDQLMTPLLEDASRLAAKLVDAGEMALDEIRDRLEDDAKRAQMPTVVLRQIVETAMDRTVAPPKTATPATQAPAAITINFGTPVDRTPKENITIQGNAIESKNKSNEDDS